MYSSVLWINSFFCLIVGGLLVLNPSFFVPTGDPLVLMWLRLIGFGFLPMAFLSFLMLIIKTKDVYLVGFSVLALFHLGMTAGQIWTFLDGLTSLSFLLAHGILGLIVCLIVVRLAESHHRRMHHVP